MKKDKILLVDDDKTLLHFLSEYLKKRFDVLTALGGAEGLRVAYREQPDLVVMDVMMPGMDGWDSAERLRELSDLPIILLTAKATEEDKLRGFRIGVDDYVTKPFSFAELEARILAILHRSAPAQPGERRQVAIGDVILDMDKREARRGEEAIPLTPTEYRLLEILVDQAGKAVAENDLLQEIWGTLHKEETAAVRRYIWMLRQKIEPDPSRPRWIVTVRGYGYRLETTPATALTEE
ncbi:MAG: response regulator transcription factor [Anaerolineae bacterium]|jgi:two-component system KDP operon response regulator KdpE|nr:response regulator transcription factor [Anaerolineae bacterium]